MKLAPRTMRLLCSSAAGLCLAGCGGGEVGGTLTGLGTGLSVTLTNNGSDALTLSSNGLFAFADRLQANDSYVVAVQTQPVGQSCSVTNGSGTLDADGSSVDNVRVSCAFTASLRGVVSGLAPGVALTLINGSNQLAITANGAFAFSALLADGVAYDVRVLTQPAGATCTVQDGSGTFIAASFRDITVSCI